MSSKSRPHYETPSNIDPADFFPFRGQYGSTAAGGLLFCTVRSFVPLITYSLLAPPSSSLSISNFFRGALVPSRPPPSGTITSIPFLPSLLLQTTSQTLELAPYPSLILLGTVFPSISFAFYNLLWRRERLPLSGQGGAYQITLQVNLIDTIHGVLFAYTAARNPTWSPQIFGWCPVFYVLGLLLHVTADHSKYLFRRKPENQDKVLTSGVWGVVRHPNLLGFLIWRTAFATAAGGLAFGGVMFAGFVWLFVQKAVPIMEAYMKRAHTREWEAAVEKVRWKLVPGIW